MLTGWKAKLAGAGVMLDGLGMFMHDALTPPVSWQVLGHDALVFLTGLAIVGFASKIQRFIDALKEWGVK